MAITVNKTFGAEWYTPIDQLSEKEGDRARFKLKELNREQIDSVMEGSTSDSNGNLQLTQRGISYALKFGIVEWENINDETGKPLKCNFTNHRYLPWALGPELAGEIVSKSILKDSDAKNS